MSEYTNIKRKLLQTPGLLYEDKDFPASNSSLYFRTSWSSSLIEWKRPREIVDNPKFVVNDSQYVDLEQGDLGNCWFIAAAASLAADDWKLLYRVVPQDQSFDSDYAGIFRFQFWQYGVWKEVVIDDRLPTRSGKLIYCKNTKQNNEFWMALLEKAYAKMYGCYEAIDGGRITDALVDLTGGISELLDLKDTTLEKLTSILTTCSQMDTLMGAAIFGREAREVRLPTGLYQSHAYSIIRLQTVTYQGKEKLLLLLRNPFGHGEWNGSWSDNSREWLELSSKERSAESLSRRDNGEFWISVEDFITNFDELEMCHLSLDAMTPILEISAGKRKQWKSSDFHGCWLRNVSAGGPLKSFTSRLFWSNPQYRIKLEHNKKCSLVVSLMEISNKFLRAADDVSIGFIIFQLKSGKEPEGKLTADNYYEHTPQLADTSGVFWLYRECSRHFILDPGSYIVVPCTFRSNMEADFFLRVFSEVTAAAEPYALSLFPKHFFPNQVGILSSIFVGRPVEETVGPLEEINAASVDTIERLFLKHQGHDGQVDAFDLQKVLEEAKSAEHGRIDGYSLETCRCLLSLLDTNIVGTIKLDNVKTAWSLLQIWTNTFKSADVNEDNTVDAFELREMYKKIGFVLDTETLQRIVRRYGGREGKIHEDDFIQSFCRILALYQTFKKKSSDGVITQTLSEFTSVKPRVTVVFQYPLLVRST